MRIRTSLFAIALSTACTVEGPPPGSADPVVRAHLVIPESGPLGELGQGWRAAADLAKTQLNEAGVFGDAELELVTHDESTLDVDETLTRIEDDGDALVLGPSFGPTFAESMDRFRESPLTFLSPTTTSAGLEGLPGVFRVSPDQRELARMMADLFQGEGGHVEACEEIGVIAGAHQHHLIVAGTLEASVADGVETFRVPIAQDPTADQLASTRDALAAGFGLGRRCVALLVFPGTAEGLIEAGVFESLGLDVIVVSDALTNFPLPFAPARRVIGLQNTHARGAAYASFAATFIDADETIYSAQVYDSVILGGLALARQAATAEDLGAVIVDLSRGDRVFLASDLDDVADDILSGASLDYRGASGALDLDEETHGSPGPFAVLEIDGGAWREVGVLGPQ